MRNTIAAFGAILAAACAASTESRPQQAPSATPALPPLPASAPAPAASATTPSKQGSITSKSPEAVAEFKKGRDLFENIRPADSVQHFKKAIALDPDFALAHAYLGMAMEGSDGVAEVEKAATLSTKLPEAERTHIEAILAMTRGDEAKAAELENKLVKLTPDDWRAHYWAAERARRAGDWARASESLKRASELNPKVGVVYNELGYAYLSQSKKDEAIAAFKKYVELSPNEPNPHDSLGDALLRAGRFAEAEAEYTKATEVQPKFWIAWQGVAQSRALRGDWKGAYEALANAKQAATRAVDRFEVDLSLAWTAFGEGNHAEATKTLDAAEKAAATDKLDEQLAVVSLQRAAMLLEANRAADALKHVATGLDRLSKPNVPGMAAQRLRLFALLVKTGAESRLRKKDDAKKTAQALEEEAKKSPDQKLAHSNIEFARALVALANNDSKGALEHFAKCTDEDAFCHYYRLQAVDKKDKAGNDAIIQKIVGSPFREAPYLYVSAKLGGIPKLVPEPTKPAVGSAMTRAPTPAKTAAPSPRTAVPTPRTTP